MNQPSPAIVAQAGVRRLPRWSLLLFCLIYALAGFVWRDPWKGDDITSFGYMLELAQGRAPWLAPGLLGEPANFHALLPYWLGAWAIRLAPAGMSAALAVRLLFMAVLLLALLCSWYAVYYLARSRAARPVSFAFGGEARPADYARAIADAGLLGLLACLGLAEMAHQTAPALVQLCCGTMLMLGLAALPYRAKRAAVIGSLGMVGLTLSGAPAVALLMGLLGLLVHALGHAHDWLMPETDYECPPEELQRLRRRRWWSVAGLALALLGCAALAQGLDLWRWRLEPLPSRWVGWRNLIRMQLWFAWPLWPFAIWTLWRWRHQWRSLLPSRHLALPLGLALIGSVGAFVVKQSEMLLFLALPAYAALAAFALPTFKRSAASLIDWFTLILFSLAAIYIWFVWVAAITGVPPRPAARVYRLLAGYTPRFEWWPFLIGLAATLGWLALVRWRTSRLPPAIWKSMILPAGGVVMCWVMLTSLWLPALNYARSYEAVARGVAQVVRSSGEPDCIQQYGLEDGQITALLYYEQLPITRDRNASHCPWLLAYQGRAPVLAHAIDMQQWQHTTTVRRAGSKADVMAIYARRLPGQAAAKAAP
ncbi:MAG: hypothetical protein Q4A28_09440 [Brachymonas sp.]|nr:hypothetical protein [Brachymonas sp.]